MCGVKITLAGWLAIYERWGTAQRAAGSASIENLFVTDRQYAVRYVYRAYGVCIAHCCSRLWPSASVRRIGIGNARRLSAVAWQRKSPIFSHRRGRVCQSSPISLDRAYKWDGGTCLHITRN